jgi:hypothetical protein
MWLHCKVFSEEVVEISRCCGYYMVQHGLDMWGRHISPWTLVEKTKIPLVKLDKSHMTIDTSVMDCGCKKKSRKYNFNIW